MFPTKYLLYKQFIKYQALTFSYTLGFFVRREGNARHNEIRRSEELLALQQQHFYIKTQPYITTFLITSQALSENRHMV